MAKRNIAKTKTKKKKWVSVTAPKLFNEVEIGESYVTEPEVLVGRKLFVNMMNLTNDPKKQNISIFFQIKEIKEGKARTYATGYEMSNASVKRFVRRGRNRVDDSFKTKTAENLIVRVKPIVITNNITTKPVLSKLRAAAKKELAVEFSKTHFNHILDSVFRNELQKKMKSTLGKIYPVRNFEIRVLKLVDTNQEPKEVAKKTREAPKREEVKTEVKDEKKAEVKEEKPKEAKEEVKEEKPKKAAKKKAEEPAKKDE